MSRAKDPVTTRPSTDPVAVAFTGPREFEDAPLYRVLARTVAGTADLLALARLGRPGQYPTFLFFGAVHHLLLQGVGHPLARYYPSIVGNSALPPDDLAGGHLIDFCARNRAELADTISTRLVQTNHVQRALGLRIGLSVLPKGRPYHLIEVGASAGLNLRFDRYGYTVGGTRYGDRDSPVQIEAALYGEVPLPDLDDLPLLAGIQGVDLNPVDVRDPDARAWLEALVWPENHDQRTLLSAALALTATDPPEIRPGDAVDVLPRIAAELPAGEPRIVYHSATRMHVPADRQAAFDDAIESVGDNGPLWWLSVEDAPHPDPRRNPTRRGAALRLRTPTGTHHTIAVVNGHLRWVETIASPL